MGVTGLAEFRTYDDYENKDDDVTSQGDSVMAPSPLSAHGDFFVREFASGQPDAPTFGTSINDVNKDSSEDVSSYDSEAEDQM